MVRSILGQAVHAQQISQVGGVAFVVLHPSVGEALHPKRVGQVHDRAHLGQRVRGPIPAVSGFQHDLG